MKPPDRSRGSVWPPLGRVKEMAPLPDKRHRLLPALAAVLLVGLSARYLIF